MRILHILDHSIPLQSGYAFRTLAILRAQHDLGWETIQLTSPKQGVSANDEEVVDGLRFYRTRAGEGLLSSIPVAKEIGLMACTARRLDEVVQHVKPDILHAHSPSLNAIPALRVGRRNGIPVVYEVRAFWEDGAVDHGTSSEWGLRYRLTRGLETYALKRADAVTTICEGLRGDIIARGIAPSKVTIIPNAVNVEDFTPGVGADDALKRKLGLHGARIVGYIGSFYAYEGLDLLIEALPIMLRNDPAVRLLLAGGGPQAEALKARASALGVSDKVVFPGRVPHDEVQRYYDLIDLLAYPRKSIRLTELVTPLKPLEAMAMGKILIASDIGGHRELIDDGSTGVLFKPNDAGDLAKKAIALLGTPDRWAAMRAAGRAFVTQERNWAANVARYKSIYEGLAAVGRSHHPSDAMPPR